MVSNFVCTTKIRKCFEIAIQKSEILSLFSTFFAVQKVKGKSFPLLFDEVFMIFIEDNPKKYSIIFFILLQEVPIFFRGIPFSSRFYQKSGGYSSRFYQKLYDYSSRFYQKNGVFSSRFCQKVLFLPAKIPIKTFRKCT